MTLAFPAIAIAFGLWIIVDPAASHGKDLAVRLPAGLFVILGGAIPALYILGMRVEADPDQVSKVYLFGLFRERIPISHLATTVELGWSRGSSYPYGRFMNVDGRGAFNLIPRQVWRSSDVNELLRLSTYQWSLDARPKRQHGALLGFLVLVASVGLVLVLVWYGEAAQNAAAG
jgi:hypothetical protein